MHDHDDREVDLVLAIYNGVTLLALAFLIWVGFSFSKGHFPFPKSELGGIAGGVAIGVAGQIIFYRIKLEIDLKKMDAEEEARHAEHVALMKTLQDARDSAELRRAMSENDGFTTLEAIIAARTDRDSQEDAQSRAWNWMD